MYVAGPAITAFSVDLNGGLTNIGQIAGSNTGLNGVHGIATDAKNNIYVSNSLGDSSSVTEYAAGSLGNVAPSATITGPHTQLGVPFGMAVDSLNNLYVANWNSNLILEYASGANGDATPIATIPYPAPMGLALDGHGNLFVTHGFQNGGPDVADILSLATGQQIAQLPGHAGGAGIALDSAGGAYVTNNSGLTHYIAPSVGTAWGDVGTVAGATLGICIDSAGRIFGVGGGDFTQTTSHRR